MIEVSYNVDQFIRGLDDVGRKQLPFALQLTLNRTAEERQKRMQDRITSQLTIRRPNDRTLFAKTVQFGREDRADAKRNRLEARIRILGKSDTARTALFQRFSSIVLRQEEGGPRTSDALYRAGSGTGQFASSRNRFVTGGFIIPAPGLRTAARGVSRKLYPTAIGLAPTSAIAGGTQFASQYKGGKKKKGGFRKGTKFYFVKENVGIFVREQVGASSEYDAVWFFRRRITLPKRLRLEETFTNGLADNLQANFNGFFAYAMKTAK